MTKQNWTGWLLFLLLSLVWGSSFILMKQSTRVLTGIQVGSLRILAAGIAFLPFALFHLRKIPLRRLPLVILSGLLGNLFPAFLFATAIERNANSALAAILNALTPLFVVLVGVLFYRVRVPGRRITGVLIGFAGLVVLNLSRQQLTLSGLVPTLLILLATFMYGFNVNMVGQRLKDVPALYIATVSMACIAIPAGIVAAQQNVFSLIRYDVEAREALLYTVILGVVGSAIATALFYVLIQRAGGLFASLVTYAIPIVAIGWGLLDHEPVTLLQLGCLGMILTGVYIANR